jgi:hypothetical protein
MNRREIMAGIAALGLFGEGLTGARADTPAQPNSRKEAAGGWPDLLNSGVPADVKLTASKGMNVRVDGAVIDALDIDGAVQIAANDVTFRRCRIRAASFSVIRIKPGVSGAKIEDCEIDGVGDHNDGCTGIFGSGVFRRNNIHHIENGIAISQGATSSVIEDNYIHDLLASGSPHYDPIQIDGDISNVTIRHNTLVNTHDQTSAIMIDNYFGPIANILVEDNLMIGGGFTIYVDARFNASPVTNVRIVNNHMGRGKWGVTSFYKTKPVYEGNVSDGRLQIENLRPAKKRT